MRSLAVVCGLLLAACSTTPSQKTPVQPQACFHYADLDLHNPVDGQMLLSRVERAATDYCRRYSAIVTPYHRQADPHYCPETIRVQLLWAMPPELCRAYDRARDERPTG